MWRSFLLVLSLVLAHMGCSDDKIEITADHTFSKEVPVSISGNFTSVAAPICICQNEREMPLQKTTEGNYIFIPAARIEAGAVLTIRSCTNQFTAMRMERQDGHLNVAQGPRPILAFAEEVQLPSDDVPTYYGRNGFIHPLYSPSGVKLTEGYPRGHTHQHGIFHAWTRSTVRGQMIDFWNQHSRLGTVHLTNLSLGASGPVRATFEADLEYLAYVESDTLVTAKEHWTIHTYACAEQNVIDVTIEQTPSIDSLVIDEYHYGGFGFRATDAWNLEGTNRSPYDSIAFIATSLDDDHLSANHTRPEWVAMWGLVDTLTAGVAIVSHQDNFRHPQPVRVHPIMPYFTFAPMVLGEFVLTPDDAYSASYRIVAYDGKLDVDLLEQLAKGFQEMP